MGSHERSFDQGRGGRRWFWSISVLLLVFGALVRIIGVADFPMQIHNDESASAIDGVQRFLKGEGGWALYGSAFGGHPNLSYWLSALPSRIVGELSVWTLRLGAAWSGILSLLLLALFVAQAFGRRVALYFLVFIVPYHYHLHFSRTGFPYIHAVLLMALVSVAFGSFITSQTAKRSFFTGITMGLALLVYPATHVLPFAIAAAVVIGLLPDFVKREGGVKGSLHGVKLTLWFLLGIVIAIGPQAAYTYRYGYTSRLNTTFVLHEQNLRHLGSQTNDPNVTKAGIVWFNFKRTLEIFYASDTGEQYQFNEAPLPKAGAALAFFGLILLTIRCLRREPIAIYLMTTACLTLITSTLMVEGNFSPHTVLFSALIPIAMALGWDKLLSLMRIRHGALVILVTASVGVAWGYWNWMFYNRVVSPERSRLNRPVNYALRLPIDAKGVKGIVAASSLNMNFGESYYTLVYPGADTAVVAASTPGEQVLDFIAQRQCPCILIEDNGDFPALKTQLEEKGRTFREFRYKGIDLVYLYIE